MKTSRKVGIGAGSAGAITAALLLVQPWEGLWLVAKPDRLAYGIATVCYGETEGVKVGDRYTKAQCSEMLRKKLPRYDAEIGRCITVPVSDKTRGALISFAYNVGSTGFCRSTAARKLNAGDTRGACDALLMWTRAGGQFRQGLLNRRHAERKLCIEGIGEAVTAEKPAQAEPKKKGWFQWLTG